MSEYLVIDLFSGLGGFSQAFEHSPKWDVIRVDIEERFEPDIRADVMDLRPSDLPEADVVLASPRAPISRPRVITTSGISNGSDPLTRNRRMRLHSSFTPSGSSTASGPGTGTENPRRSRIRWFIGPPDEWVTYCQYGAPYQKQTGLWGDFAPMTFKRCSKGDACHVSNTETDGTSAIASMPRYDHAERSKVPFELFEAIRRSIETAFENPPPKQAKLTGEGGVAADV